MPKYVRRCYWLGPLVLAALLFASLRARADSPPALVVPTEDAVSLEGHLDVLFDTTRSLQFEQVRSPEHAAAFVPVGHRSFAKALREGMVWLRFTIENGSEQRLDRFLQIHNNQADEVEVFLLDDAGMYHRYQAGENTEIANRLIPLAKPTFPVSLGPHQRKTHYVRLYAEGALAAGLQVATWPRLMADSEQQRLMSGFLWGIFFLVFVYCTYFYARFRETLYGWLSLAAFGFQLAITWYMTGDGGYWFLSAANRPWFSNRISLLGLTIAAGGTLSFLRELLAVPKHSPLLDRVLRIIQWFYLIWAVAVFVLPYLVSARVMPLMVALNFVPTLAAVVFAFRGDRVAKLVTISSSAMMLGSLVSIARTFGLLSDDFLSNNAPLLGFALHIVVLSAAVADRMDENRRTRQKALEDRLAEAERNAALTRTFARFVPMEFLDRLDRRNITDIELGVGIEKRMTTLFSDIRSFTSLVEQMTPQENFSFINEYLGYMEPEIHDNHGFIDKYIGDAIMALFDGEDGGALHAVRAAIGMHRALERYNNARIVRNQRPLEIGIGLHTGRLMLGTIGGRDRLNASVIGDSVNLASRIEGMTKAYGARLLITEATAQLLSPDAGFQLRPVDRVRVRGKSEAVTVYEVLDAETADRRASKLAALPDHERAWQLYQAGDFVAARDAFAACQQRFPADPLFALHMSRCSALLQQEPAAAWDGVISLDHK